MDQLTELLSDGDVIQRGTLSQAVTGLTPDIGKREDEGMVMARGVGRWWRDSAVCYEIKLLRADVLSLMVD